MSSIYLNQTGLKFLVETASLPEEIDYTDATCEVLIKKPTGTIITYPVTLENSSVFSFTITEETDLDEVGRYTLQAKITKSNMIAHGEVSAFEVKRLLK